MLSKLKSLWSIFKRVHRGVPHEDIVMARTYTVTESTRESETKKRVAQAFAAQEQEMNARALKPHSCRDPIGCTKVICFEFVPDKIVSKPYQVRMRKRRKNPKVDDLDT